MSDTPDDKNPSAHQGNGETKSGAPAWPELSVVSQDLPPPLEDPLQDLVARTQADGRAVFAPATVEALLQLEETDPLGFARLHWELTTKANVVAGMLRKVLSRARAEQKKAEKAAAAALNISDADLLVQRGRQAQYVCDIDNRGIIFAEFNLDGAVMVGLVGGADFRDWLTREYLEATGRAPSRDALLTAIDTLRAVAKKDAPKHKLYIRVGFHAGKIYLDRGTPERDAIEIDADGYRCVATPPVKFIRPDTGFGVLPVPVPGGSIDELKKFLNLARPRDFDNSIGWVLGCYQEAGQLTHLFIGGLHGSAKSTALRFLLGLVDPPMKELPGPPRTETDTWVVARTHYVVIGDNIKHLSVGMSVVLCLLSNGGQDQRRSLYTNADEFAIIARRPFASTSTKALLTEEDLLDRTTVIMASKSFDEEGNEDQRRQLADLTEAYAKEQPRLLGAILKAVSEGLRRQNEPPPKRLPRMADFATWICRCTPGLGWRQERILNSYREAVHAAAQDLCDTDLLASAVINLLEENPDGWEGPATVLLNLLRARVGERIARNRDWPVNQVWLSRRLNSLSPTFARLGLRLSLGRNERARHLAFRWSEACRPETGSETPPPKADSKGAPPEADSKTAPPEADSKAAPSAPPSAPPVTRIRL